MGLVRNGYEINEECFICGSQEDLQGHHLIPQSRGGSDDPRNIVTVCADCHAKIHGYDNINSNYRGPQFQNPKKISITLEKKEKERLKSLAEGKEFTLSNIIRGVLYEYLPKLGNV